MNLLYPGTGRVDHRKALVACLGLKLRRDAMRADDQDASLTFDLIQRRHGMDAIGLKTRYDL